MKTRILLLAIAITSGLLFSSCNPEEEETAKPVITLSELGLNNCKIGYRGSDLHVEADVVAEGKINTIEVIIHQEGTEDKDNNAKYSWEFDTTYTEFAGLKNTTFHKHIDIPADVDTGVYHFHFIVTDMEGNQTTVEEEIQILQAEDNIAPEITVATFPVNNAEFINGQTISITGMVGDEQALGGLYIGLVRENQNLTDANVNDENTITLLHTHDFGENSTYNFIASINVGTIYDNNIEPKEIIGDIAWQSANYYLLVKCKDAAGNWTYSAHYPIIINY